MTRKLILLILLFSFGIPASAIELELKGLDGSIQRLSDFRGNWVVVNYWATWCPPCLDEMPELQAFYDDNASRGAIVIGINSELLARDKLVKFLDDYFISYPIFTSPPLSQSVLGAIPGIPTTFLISPQGNVVARQVGSVTQKMLENFIQKWEP